MRLVTEQLIKRLMRGEKLVPKDSRHHNIKYCYYDDHALGSPFKFITVRSTTTKHCMDTLFDCPEWVEYEEPAKELSIEQLEGILGYKVKIVGDM